MRIGVVKPGDVQELYYQRDSQFAVVFLRNGMVVGGMMSLDNLMYLVDTAVLVFAGEVLAAVPQVGYSTPVQFNYYYSIGDQP